MKGGLRGTRANVGFVVGRVRRRDRTYGESVAPLARKLFVCERLGRQFRAAAHLTIVGALPGDARRCDACLAPLAITRDAQLIEVCEASEPLLRAAREVIDRLRDQLVDSGYVVVLTNAAGCILKIVGDRGIRSRLARIDFVAGGDWSEAAAGTNAIGTALSDRRAVQLLAAEHFCDGWTNLTCTAVPIRDPRTGDVLGVLDVTGDYRLIRAHLTNLLAISVLEIEDRLRRLHDRPSGPPRVLDVVSPNVENARAADDVFLTFASGAIGASLDVAATLRTVCEQTEAVLKAQSTAVFLFANDNEAPYQHVWSQSGGNRDDELAATLEDCEAVCVLRERGEAILADDVTSASFFGERASAGRFGSIALLPLPTARGTIAFVAAARRNVAPWQFVDVRRAFALMACAATAIENARLFEALRQRNRHIETINATAQLLSELLDPADHLDQILRAIVDSLGYVAGTLYLRSRDYGMFEKAASYGNFCGSAASAACGESHHTVALSAGTGTLGLLELCSGHASRSRGDRATIAAVAQQLAMALNNAQLLRTAGEVEVLRRADRLKSDFLATVSHDLHSPLTAICAGIDGSSIAPKVSHATMDFSTRFGIKPTAWAASSIDCSISLKSNAVRCASIANGTTCNLFSTMSCRASNRCTGVSASFSTFRRRSRCSSSIAIGSFSSFTISSITRVSIRRHIVWFRFA